MSRLTLTPTRMQEGVWHGQLVQDGPGEPLVRVSYLDQDLDAVSLTPTEENTWDLSVVVPPEAIADGIHTVLITDRTDDTRLAAFSFIAGEAIGEDIRAEIELLRGELDLLKRAFRRHCVETT